MASAPLAPEAAASAPAGPVPASSAAAVQAAAPAVSVASAVAPSVASSVATGAAASGLRVPVAAPGGLPAPVAQSAQPAPTAAPVQPTVQPNLPSAGAQAAPLQLQADQATWVDVRDARGQVLVSRLVRAGETLQMAGTPPLKLTIGNAPGTRLVFRGKVVDLAPATRDSVARLELQ
jgi:cytoskeleton protein RodZ